jgi:hypothetical protein
MYTGVLCRYVIIYTVIYGVYIRFRPTLIICCVIQGCKQITELYLKLLVTVIPVVKINEALL